MRMVADVTGSVLINGWSVNQAQMKRLSGFVPQFDIAISSLTVREHLTFVVGQFVLWETDKRVYMIWVASVQIKRGPLGYDEACDR